MVLAIVAQLRKPLDNSLGVKCLTVLYMHTWSTKLDSEQEHSHEE